jgi:hypothetical protein
MTEANRRLRSVGAVAGGFAATFLLSVATDAIMHLLGWFPAPGKAMAGSLFVVAALYRAAFTMVGGYVTARLAPDRPFGHACALAIIGLLAGTGGVIAFHQGAPGTLGPAWYAYSIPLMAIPCVLVGGILWTRRPIQAAPMPARSSG